MSFLVKSELKTVATITMIDKITAADDAIVTEIIDESIATMKSYLAKFYDVATIFAATGTARHLTVLKWLKYIVIYEIYIRHTREQNAVAQGRYNEAMAWLEKMNTGEFNDKTLPALPDTDNDAIAGNSGDIRFGSGSRYTSNY